MPTPWNPATVAVTPQDHARGRKRAQRMYPLTECEACGATRQLSRDHRDRNPLNNSSEKVAILCLPCHTAKEWRTGAYASRPKPILVRGARGRIMGTLPTRSIASTESRRTERVEESRSPSRQHSASGRRGRRTADPAIPSRSSQPRSTAGETTGDSEANLASTLSWDKWIDYVERWVGDER